MATGPAPLTLIPSSEPGRCWGEPKALLPVVDRKSWPARLAEDIACAAIVVFATIFGLAALTVGLWSEFITSESAALAAGASPLLGIGLAAVGRRKLAVRSDTTWQSALHPALAAAIVAVAVVACLSVLLATPLHAAALQGFGFVVGAAVAGLLANQLLRSRWVSMRLRRNVAVYGASSETRTVLEAIAADANVAFAGLYEDRAPGGRIEYVGQPVDGGLGDLATLIANRHVDDVIIALPASAVDRVHEISNRLLELPVDVAIAPAASAASFNTPGVASVQLGGRALPLIHCRPITGWGALAKNGIDRVLAAVALTILSPLLGLIALAIKLESNGPIFFRQRRHGVCGKPIVVWKFRTMRVMEDGAVVRQASRNDDRITCVGRILRRTSLDELPQLINVLEGSMSLVGPRPHAIAHDEHYGALIPTYTRRSIVRPGITGWAQINGLRGETRTTAEMAERVEHDLWYVANWSIALDIKILLHTPIYGLVNKNAY